MRSAAFVLAIAVSPAMAVDGVHLDHALYIPNTDDYIGYDDGTAYWLTWGGLYRGVWFDLADFGLSGSWPAQNTEYWFYHHASYPWDTASFYGEMYNGGSSAPTTLLDQTSVTATHYAAVYAFYATPVVAEEQFWVLVNSEMSAGGWPSILGDPTYTTDHSFFSDDFVVWEPWGLGDYFIRTTPFGALAPETWGSIKAIYSN